MKERHVAKKDAGRRHLRPEAEIEPTGKGIHLRDDHALRLARGAGTVEQRDRAVLFHGHPDAETFRLWRRGDGIIQVVPVLALHQRLTGVSSGHQMGEHLLMDQQHGAAVADEEFDFRRRQTPVQRYEDRT